MEPPERIQLHLALPFKKQPRDHPRIAALLAQGFRLVELQRVTDKEVAVTLARVARSQPRSDPGALEAPGGS